MSSDYVVEFVTNIWKYSNDFDHKPKIQLEDFIINNKKKQKKTKKKQKQNKTTGNGSKWTFFSYCFLQLNYLARDEI